MSRFLEGPRQADGELVGGAPRAISFALRHSNSAAFKALFKEGMALVESTAAYLDGPGRAESKALRRPVALAYATESMRLTTRLMQVASWLLLRRAVNEGELTPAQAQTERHRVRLQRQDLVSPSEIVAELPPAFIDHCIRSLRLQERVLHLDRSIIAARTADANVPPPALAAQVARLRAAFASGQNRRPD